VIEGRKANRRTEMHSKSKPFAGRNFLPEHADPTKCYLPNLELRTTDENEHHVCHRLTLSQTCLCLLELDLVDTYCPRPRA
jgi:hypothetical protein